MTECNLKTSDHDLLIRIDERVGHMQRNYQDHLDWHKRYRLLTISSFLSALTAIIIAWVRR